MLHLLGRLLILLRGVDLRANTFIQWQSLERLNGHPLRHVPLQASSRIPNVGGPGADLGIELIDAICQRHALRTDDDPVEIPAMLRGHYLAGEDVFTHVGRVEDSDIGMRRVPGTITEDGVSPSVEEQMYVWRTAATQARAA